MATSTDAPAPQAPRRITDPALLPSIVPRISRIAQLLQDSQNIAEQEPVETEKTEMDEMETGDASEPMSSSLALGAIADDDDMDTWTQRGTGAHASRIPSSLLAQLAQETTQLRQTFKDAQAAIDAAPGGDMGVAEQEALIAQLEAYAAKQEYVKR